MTSDNWGLSSNAIEGRREREPGNEVDNFLLGQFRAAEGFSGRFWDGDC